MAETTFYEPVSTPPKLLFLLTPLEATNWLRSLVFKVFPLATKRKLDWNEITFAGTSGIVTREMENYQPIADQRVTSNNPKNNCGTSPRFFSSGSGDCGWLVAKKGHNQRGIRLFPLIAANVLYTWPPVVQRVYNYALDKSLSTGQHNSFS